MTTTLPRAGARFSSLLLLAAAFLGWVGQSARAQDALRPDERSKFESYRSGNIPSGDAESKPLFEKSARFFVAKLGDNTVEREGMQELMREFRARLQMTNPYPKLTPPQQKFVEEYGKVLVEHLKQPALTSSKNAVRVNAARMLAEVCHSGYEGAADLCVQILDKPEETNGPREAARLYALLGLDYLFAIVPNPAIPERTIFHPQTTAHTELEIRSIQALINYVLRKPINDPNIQPEALQYIRRTAVHALGHVRLQTVKDATGVRCRPALVLLKVAEGDGLNPPPTIYERAWAVIGFCQLTADRDRDLQLDYALQHLGQAILQLSLLKANNPQDQSVPWKELSQYLGSTLDNWQGDAVKKNLDGAPLAAAFANLVSQNVLKPIETGAAGAPPNLEVLRGWLKDNAPKSTSLFKSDPATTVTPPPQ